jgi:hypothetical protein
MGATAALPAPQSVPPPCRPTVEGSLLSSTALSSIARDPTGWSVWFIRSVWLVWSVWCVWVGLVCVADQEYRVGHARPYGLGHRRHLLSMPMAIPLDAMPLSISSLTLAVVPCSGFSCRCRDIRKMNPSQCATVPLDPRTGTEQMPKPVPCSPKEGR